MRDRFHDIFDRLRDTNRYVLALGVYVIWMGTLAEVDIFRMVGTRMERRHIESRIVETKEEIQSLDIQLAEIRQNPEAKERHAREAYYMHRSNEDVYVFR